MNPESQKPNQTIQKSQYVPPQLSPSSTKIKIFLIGIFIFTIIAIPTVLIKIKNEQMLYESSIGFTPRNSHLQTPQKQQTATVPTPTIDPTANWKTYANMQYEYSFRYPPNFYQIPIDKNTLQFTPIPWPSGEIGQNELNKVGYGIGVLVSSTNQSLEEIASKYDQFKTRPGYSSTPITIDGVSGLKLTSVAIDFPTDAVVVLKNNREYFIYVKYYSLEKTIEAKNIFNQILSTFKFTQ